MRVLLELEVVLNKEALSVDSSALRPAKLFFTTFILNKIPPNNDNCSKLVEN